jgi:hypothetical protein
MRNNPPNQNLRRNIMKNYKESFEEIEYTLLIGRALGHSDSYIMHRLLKADTGLVPSIFNSRKTESLVPPPQRIATEPAPAEAKANILLIDTRDICEDSHRTKKFSKEFNQRHRRKKSSEGITDPKDMVLKGTMRISDLEDAIAKYIRKDIMKIRGKTSKMLAANGIIFVHNNALSIGPRWMPSYGLTKTNKNGRVQVKQVNVEDPVIRMVIDAIFINALKK